MSGSSTHCYVVHRGGVSVYSTDDLEQVITYLWSRQLRFKYVVFDYERPYPFDNANIVEWITPLLAGC